MCACASFRCYCCLFDCVKVLTWSNPISSIAKLSGARNVRSLDLSSLKPSSDQKKSDRKERHGI